MIWSTKKKILISLMAISFLFAGYTLINNINKMPKAKPKEFNFVLNYGICAKNQIDTIKGQYTKDMITEPAITTNLVLTEEEMNTIYFEMRKINILSYPDKFTPMSFKRQTPFMTYSIKIFINGKEKNIYWKDEKVSESKKAVKLRELFRKIDKIIERKEEYKKLPEAKGGYC